MKLELRKVTHNARLSHETAAYAAEIWVDGVKRGTAENDGQGGPDRICPHSLQVELEAYAATLPKVKFFGEEHEQNADILLGSLLDEHLATKRLLRMTKTKTVMVRDGKAYTMKGRPANVAPGTVFLNDLPLAEALKAFRAAGG